MEYDDRVMCPLIDEKIDPMECVDVVAVSYTHLDVYKRQDYG